MGKLDIAIKQYSNSSESGFVSKIVYNNNEKTQTWSKRKSDMLWNLEHGN